MRILLHGLNFAPELTGIGKYSGEMAEWLAERGHQVRVVTTPPYYPAWRVSPPYRWWAYRAEQGRVRVYRCPLWVPGRPSGVTRVLHLMSFALSSLPVMLRQALWRPDVVMTVAPALFCAPVALGTAMLCRASAWLHVQDFEVDAAFELGLLPRTWKTQRFAYAFESRLLRSFTRVSTISPKMVERLSAKKGVDSGRTVLFPNWADVDQILPSSGPNAYRAELGLGPERVVALYAGNMGVKQGLELLPELARRMIEEDRIHFLFCGDGAFRPQLEAQCAGLRNVSLLPLQPRERLNELLNAADIHLLPQRPDAADLVMPSKLTGMLASGRPVLATAAEGTQLAEAVRGRGFVVPPGDVEAARQAIVMLANSPELRVQMGARARRYAVNFLGRDRVLARFEAELLALARGPQAREPEPAHP